jgi:UDP-N-acetylmuramate dehydrogenase
MEYNIDLKDFTTFGVSANAKKFTTFSTEEEARNLTKNNNEALLILGGGSNILLTQDFNGLVLKNEIKGISIIEKNNVSVVLKVGAGEEWHNFVLHTIENGYFGIENMSLIPGSVGASPMQNIGAYGVEIKDVFEKLEALEIETGEIHEFTKEACAFGYRESVFKHALKGKYIITHVYFRLSLVEKISTKYGAIEQELLKNGISNPTSKDVSNAVIAIRSSKLPNPKDLGNAGSFFKNPVVPIKLYNKIRETFSDAPAYPIDENSVKVPAGWLIESAGWKGKKIGACGVHVNQALVLVNYGGATGNDILNLSTEIIENIYQKFGIVLEREVNIL